MPNTTPSIDGPEIGLAEMIESLRHELQISLEKSKNQAVVFDVEKVELELKVAISRKTKGEGGVSFWVLKAGADIESARDMAHTFKLTLAPLDSSSDGRRLRVSSTTSEAPTKD